MSQWTRVLFIASALILILETDGRHRRREVYVDDLEHEHEHDRIIYDDKLPNDVPIADELRLLRKLMRGYSRSVRPVYNASSIVIVKLGVTLVQIFDVDEKKQVLTTTMWLDQAWHDDLLSWDPADYDGITVFRVPCKYLWLPDIVLYNSADDYTTGYMASKAMLQSDGTVFWPPPTKFRSTCEIAVTYFPFDEQVCKMKFGSWAYDGFQVDLTNRSDNVDLSMYIENGEWELVRVSCIRNVVYYTCCPEPFPDVTFTIVIRRRILYYLYNVIFPCMMMSWLTLLVFCLPPDSGEKIALGITVLLAFSVFVLAIAEKMPETSSSVPLIGIYLTVVMGMTSVSVIMTVVVLNFHHRGPSRKPVPSWLRTLILDHLAMLVCFKPNYMPRFTHCADELFFVKNKPLGFTIENFMDECKRDENRNHDSGAPSGQAGTPENHPTAPESNNASTTTRSRLKGRSERDKMQDQILKAIQLLTRRQEEEDQHIDVVNEWRQVALVIDRFLFWVFLMGTLSSSVGLLIIMPLTKQYPEV